MGCAGVILQISWDAFLNYVARTLHARRFGGFVENLSWTMKQQFLLFSYLPRSFHAPRRLEIRHRFLAVRSIATIMRVLRHPRRDRPEPAAIRRRRVRPHDAADN